MKGIERIEESLCEKSMKLVSNVIKISALSLAKRSLAQSTLVENGPKNLNQVSGTTTTPTSSVKPMLIRAQKPQTNTNQTYLVKPKCCVNNNSSSSSSSPSPSASFVVKEDMNVDGRASDFIKKVREKNQKDVFVTSENPSDRQTSSTPRLVKQ